MKKTIAVTICAAQCLLLAGGVAGCTGGSNGAPQSQTPQSVQQEQTAPKETMQETTPQTVPQEKGTLDEARPTSGQTGNDNNPPQTSQAPQNGEGQISLEDAKAAALADAGLSASDAVFTKEKSDYEDGVMVYELEFYAPDAEYEYEINAATGAVYSKDIDWHHNQERHNHHEAAAQDYIDVAQAKTIALAQAGFTEEDVTLLTCEFDYDDGIAVYEVEFYKDGREYGVTVGALDGVVFSYEVD